MKVIKWIVGLLQKAGKASVSMVADPNLRDPCPKCGTKMRHLPGRDSGSTGEAKFGCQNDKCGHQEYRGGWCSEWQYERHDR